MSSESSSPSLVVQVTDELTSPVVAGTLMITVAEALAPFASVPNVQVASPGDVVHDPEETTFTMLNPAGAGASRVVFWSGREVPLVNVVW